jgi:hypothetical protein
MNGGLVCGFVLVRVCGLEGRMQVLQVCGFVLV